MALIAALAGRAAGSAAGFVTFLLLPLVAFVGLVAVERESAVLEAVRAWLLLQRTHSGTRERLRRHRSELADVLDRVNDWLNAAETPLPSGERTPY
jgi:hypothetical protein